MDSQKFFTLARWGALAVVVVASGFAILYFINAQQNLSLEREYLETAQQTAENERAREALFAPQISLAGIGCDIPPGMEDLSGQNFSFNISAADPEKVSQQIIDASRKYPGASVALSSYSSEAEAVLDSYQSQYISGYIPTASAAEFARFIENMEDNRGVFISNTYTTVQPAKTIRANCVAEREYLQSLALQEAVYIDKLKAGSLNDALLPQITQDLVFVRSDFSNRTNGTTVPSVLNVKKQLENASFSISIADIKG